MVVFGDHCCRFAIRWTLPANGFCAREPYRRATLAVSLLAYVPPWLSTLCAGRRAVFHSQGAGCTFGEVSDGATLIGFTDDGVCIPAGDEA